jgi:hypothetical protein
VAKGQRLKQVTQIVNAFNEKFPVGTPVLLKKNTGVIKTVVMSAAKVWKDHSAVAWFRGVRGCYSIENGRVCGFESQG